MKLQKLHIKNFKSIVDLEIVEPNPFTVFVGPNGSGKSNIFEALEFASLMSLEDDFDAQLKTVNQFGGLDKFLNRKHANAPTIVLHQFDKDKGIMFMCTPKDEQIIEIIKNSIKQTEQEQKTINELLKSLAEEKGKKFSDEWLHSTRLQRVNKLLSSKYDSLSFLVPVNQKVIASFEENSNTINLSSIVKEFGQAVQLPEFEQFVDFFGRIFVGSRIGDRTKYSNYLRSDASNLAKVLGRIFKDNIRKEEIIEWLSLFVPEFEKIEYLKNPISRKYEIQIFEKNSEQPFETSFISDGTYNILALLTAVYQSDKPQFLCIEEPENGLNPYVIRKLVDFFRAACEEKGHYIWLNTHSNALVECLTPEEVIVVDKIGGETTIKQIKGMDLHGLNMAEVWLSGALGGGTPW
ncbi:AAA family ATPase [Runella sp.]|uniref:AAA family ATPase n=1 Tax=Runella sp. TaxID=1960881 RepID=UPI003D09938B